MTRLEIPRITSYNVCYTKLLRTTLFKCGFWSQGPAELQTIALMLRHDLRALGHGSADYCHLLVECIKLV